MYLYNTLNKEIEKFIPKEDKNVTMYTCGPTVYHYAHIGNLRTYIFEDVLEKTLNYIGYNVKRAMNITDVGHLTSDADQGDDKMAIAAKRENKDVFEIANYYTECFYSDIEKLNIKKPEIISKATDNIKEYIDIITKLLKEGYAYISNGNVYFDVVKFEDYYKLSGKNMDDLKLAARDDITEDENKKNPFDFGLWFTDSKFENHILGWDSPWGFGYPGWHIECCAIAIKYLGEHLDIHCGGVDLTFPHHTNEIAQAECYLGHKWCNYWVHGEFLNDTTGKMSKSKGDFLTVSLLEEKNYNPLSYRYLCLTSHYRKPLTFSYEILDGSKQSYEKLKNKIKTITKEGTFNKDLFNTYNDKFKEYLEDDLNTASAITLLYDVIKDDTLNGTTKLELIDSFDQVLSLDLLKQEQNNIDSDLENYILNKIEERKEAKSNKNYELADNIRIDLEKQGIILKDTREGTTYELRR